MSASTSNLMEVSPDWEDSLDVSILPEQPRVASGVSRYVWSQDINLARHAAALRPFRVGEFGTGPASPSEAHRVAANQLLTALRNFVLRTSAAVKKLGEKARLQPDVALLQKFNTFKERGHSFVEATEKVWNFYFELFNLRQTSVAGHLLACDRIALDCYQAIYTNLGVARSIPSPPPFSYLETGFAPATFRRGVTLSKLGKQSNPFPLIKLPYHRLVNPWTLGAIPHEVSHNLQSDLGLWHLIPKAVFRRLAQAGVDRASAIVWARWHKETFADLCGLLLSGPSFVTSLMDIVGNSPARTVAFNPRGVHPTPYLRVFINCELLRRMRFEKEAEDSRRTWNRMYPPSLARAIPQPLMESFQTANQLVVDTMCFQPYKELGGKSLSQVVMFQPRHQKIVEEAAQRLAAGTDPGILNERFFIGAARWALEHKMARPQVITENFYNVLERR